MLIEKHNLSHDNFARQAGWDIVLSKEEASAFIDALERAHRTGETVKVNMAGAPAIDMESDRVFQVCIIHGE